MDLDRMYRIPQRLRKLSLKHMDSLNETWSLELIKDMDTNTHSPCPVRTNTDQASGCGVLSLNVSY
jgi:hypothetical protein